jgi:hypothetical protein
VTLAHPPVTLAPAPVVKPPPPKPAHPEQPVEKRHENQGKEGNKP